MNEIFNDYLKPLAEKVGNNRPFQSKDAHQVEIRFFCGKLIELENRSSVASFIDYSEELIKLI